MISIISMCNEAFLANDCILSVKRVCSDNNIYIINDGEANYDMKNFVSHHKVKMIEYKKIGCKEPHLARFFETVYENETILHLDYDEILSEQLISEINLIKNNISNPYLVNMIHGNSINQKIKYRNYSDRSSKIILFNKSSLVKIIGLPHKGLVFNKKNFNFLKGPLIHGAGHISYNLLDHIKRDMHFSRLDAYLRTKKISIYSGKFFFVNPDSSHLSKFDYLRYRYPILLFPGCILYRSFQSFLWFFQVRNLYTFFYEFKIMIARMFYQVNLLLQLFYLKKVNKLDK